MATKTFRQELPPPEGYGPVDWARNHPKKYLRGWQIFLGYAMVQSTAIYLAYHTKSQIRRWQVERDGGNLSNRALLKAEKDRAYLKVIRRNRDEEEKLMKDVPGWTVGTYFGDPIYHTTPKDEWYDISMNEYFMHAREWDLKYHYNMWKFH